MGPGQILSPGGKKEGFGLDSYWGGHIFPPAGWWAGTPLEGKLRFVVAPYGGKQFSPESPLVPTIFGPDPCAKSPCLGDSLTQLKGSFYKGPKRERPVKNPCPLFAFFGNAFGKCFPVFCAPGPFFLKVFWERMCGSPFPFWVFLGHDFGFSTPYRIVEWGGSQAMPPCHFFQRAAMWVSQTLAIVKILMARTTLRSFKIS